MKVTLIHRYFWPDKAPYAQMLFSIAKGLADSKMDVSILTSMPSHHIDASDKTPNKQSVEGFSIRRVGLLPEPGRNLILRAVNTCLFALRVFINLMLSKNDIVMVATTPPVIMGMVVRWASKLKKFRYIYHCQDLHPEAMSVIGLKHDSFLYRLLNNIDKENVVGANKVIVLSEDMKITLAKRGIPIDNTSILNNFIFKELNADEHQKNLLNKDYFNILFAGNLGKFQGLEHLIDAAWITRENPRIRYILVGDGVEREKLENRASPLVGQTVFFYGHVPVTKALQFMAEANLGLIMLNAGVIEYAYPSKTMMYLSMGLPLLVSVEKESSLAKMVTQNGFGISSEPENPEALAEAVTRAWKSKNTLLANRKVITDFAKEKFGKDPVIKSWVNYYKSI